MKILCLGRQGQIARALAERAKNSKAEVIALGRPDLDILDEDSIVTCLTTHQPDIVVNAAAYTAVDAAEKDEQMAHALNADAPERVARLTAEIGIPLVHLSTDYVFDGHLERPYRETDIVSPMGVYGRTKHLGEQAVIINNSKHIILRTAWVYSPFGNNFVKTMLRLASERDDIAVVADQIGNPTSALDIADAILTISAMVSAAENSGNWGLYHLSGTGVTSWAGLAEHIFKTSKELDGPGAQVVHIPTSAYPTLAKRPKNSQLDCSKLKAVLSIELPEWRTSVSEIVRRILTGRDG